MKNKLWSVCFDNDYNQEIGHKFKITSVIFCFKDFIFDPFVSPYKFESVTLWKDVSLKPFHTQRMHYQLSLLSVIQFFTGSSSSKNFYWWIR